MTGGVFSKLWGVYERLLAATESTAAQSNVGTVRRPQSLSGRFRRDQQGIVFECVIVLENWRWRASKTNEKVTIVVHVQESLTADGNTLQRSTVRVSYFAARDNNADWLHTVHFDFGPQQACHPTFHAQLTEEAVIPSGQDAAELGCDVMFGTREGRCFKNARIPTSDMTFSSVLLCLAADHIRAEFFSQFKAEIVQIQRDMPMPNYDPAMKQSLQADVTRIGSSHWFAHVS
jgi:hypothetical protein